MDVINSAPPFGRMQLDTTLSRPLVIEGTAVALLLGLLYSLSPTTAWMAIAFAVIIRWAAYGLPRSERRWVIGILAVSVALRAVAIAIIAWRNDPLRQSFSTVFGDALYAIKMSLWIRNTYVGLPIQPRDYLEAFDIDYGHTSYHMILAILQVFVGPAPYGVHVLSVVLYLAGIVAVYRTVRIGYGRLAAFAGLGAALFLPTLFLWSILPLKESAYFFFMAMTISAVAGFFRSRSWARRAGALVLAGASLVAISSLREGGLVLALGGLTAGLAAALLVRWRLVLLVVVVLAPFAIVRAVATPAIHDRILSGMRESAARHLGHVGTPGTSYRLLDDDAFYRGHLVRDYHTLTFDEGVRFVARSIVAFVLVPRPWEPSTPLAIYMAPQQVVWYALVAFAVIGALAGLRRDRLLTCLLAGNVIVGVLVIAPNSGNVGTLIRHRDMVVPFVVWLSGVGVLATMTRFGGRLPDVTSGQPGKSAWL